MASKTTPTAKKPTVSLLLLQASNTHVSQCLHSHPIVGEELSAVSGIPEMAISVAGQFDFAYAALVPEEDSGDACLPNDPIRVVSILKLDCS